jgi:protein-tyrosine-phosphatase
MMMNQQEAEQKTYNVMFTCVANFARSILAEAAMNSMGRGRSRAFSAGSNPSDHVHPLTLRVLEKLRFDTGFARPKSWEEFSGPDAPQMDFVFSVCDAAGGEDCPDWPGHPLTAHWGLPDPKRAEGTEAQKALAFTSSYKMLSRRMGIFLALPQNSFEHLAGRTESELVAGG